MYHKINHIFFSNNFGVEPYVIEKEPLEIKIIKGRKGQSFKNFELLIDDKDFSVLKQLGASKKIINHSNIFRV